MNVAADFDDMMRDQGGEAVRRALAAATWADDGRAPFRGPQDEPEAVRFTPTPFVWRDPSTIPRREFLYGFELRRKQMSGKVAPGGAGKTTYTIGRAICMAAGLDLMGHRVWNGPHRVWLWNLEDEREEIEKTVHAFLKLWNLSHADLGGRLWFDGSDSLSSRLMKIATTDGTGGCRINRPVVKAVIDAMRDNGIDYLDVDPFVSSHSVDENDNNAIDEVSKQWCQIARETNAAIGLTHHVRKPNGVALTAHDARGASSMVNAARSCLVFQGMTKEVSEEFRIEECDRRSYFSVLDDKNNKAPPASRAEWYRFVGVGLGNGNDRGPEDNIGAIERWTPPDTFGGVTARQLLNVQRLVEARPEEARKHPKAQAWVGKLVAHVLGRSLDDPAERRVIEKMISTWCSNGALRTAERQNTKREIVEYVEVGAWATVE